MINMLKEQVLNTIKKYDLINENDKITFIITTKDMEMLKTL